MGKMKNSIRKFIVFVIVILMLLIPLLANQGNSVYASENPYPSITGGLTHTIALKSDGTVWSWGGNTSGQLGDGTGITRYTPVEVQGLSSKTITAVAAGDNFSCFLASDGTVWSVGSNNYGQLGDGTTTNRNLPVEVQGVSSKTITAIAAGSKSAYFLAADGTVWSIGLNDYGQLGDGTTTNKSQPVQVQGLSSKTITTVAVRYKSAYFLASDGTVWSVGYNDCGQLGDGTTTNRNLPVEVQGLSSKTITIVAAGSKSAYFLASDGTVWSVGYNNNGQLGNGTTTDNSMPVQVQGLSSMTISDVAAGQYAAYFLASDGTVWSVGYNNYGQLGDGTTTKKTQPVQVQGLSGKTIAVIGAGANFAYFVASDGTVWSVGYNSKGQLGDNSTNNRSIPVQVSGLTMIVNLSVTAVNQLNDINVASGTTLGQLGLPSAVMVTLDNGSIRNEPVSWDGGTPEYDGTTDEIYKFTGTLTLPSEVSNPNGYTATINVIVGTPPVTVISVNPLNDIEVTMGTSLSQVVLSDTVIINLRNGSTASSAVSWDSGTPVYDGNTSGTYKFTGTLTLPNGVSNPNDYTVKVNVTVSTTNITEGDIFDYVITGTHLTIPTRTVTITYNPDDVQLIDLFGLTTTLDTMTSGLIPDSNITIIQNTAGTIKFTVNLPISSEATWSGVLNSIKFKAKVSHPSISYTVQ